MNLLRPIANIFGYDIVKKHKTLTLRWHIDTLFHDLGINTVIDAGANIGQYGKFLRNAGLTGEIHSFEPIKNYYEQLLEESKDDDKWFAHHCALGREEGSQQINVSQSMSSFHDFSDEYLAAHKHNEKSIETVNISTMDAFISKQFKNDIDERKIYLKMDTQGFDLEVFMGLRFKYEAHNLMGWNKRLAAGRLIAFFSGKRCNDETLPTANLRTTMPDLRV